MRYALLLLAVASVCLAQQPDAQQLVAREFGPSFTADAAFAPIFGDLDGDGEEDAVVVASSKSPLGDEAEFHYRAIDPYDGYFGFGDAKVTVQFSATNAGQTRYVLVVHNWRAPKAKFVVINLPFEQLSLGRTTRKKKTIATIHAAEQGGLESDVFWDGKKYRWEPAYMGK